MANVLIPVMPPLEDTWTVPPLEVSIKAVHTPLTKEHLQDPYIEEMGPSYGHSFVLSRPRNSDAGISISSHASFKVDKGCRRGGGGAIHSNDRACVQGPLSRKELLPCMI